MRKYRFTYLISTLLLAFALVYCSPGKPENEFSERVKIALREVGNTLLLSQQDSTSLILPVVEIGVGRFQLSFEEPLTFEPSALVAGLKQSTKKWELPNTYRVTVSQCIDNEVAYSYEISGRTENTIVPCGGRMLPLACYTIEVHFAANELATANNELLFYSLVTMVLAFLILVFYSKYHAYRRSNRDENVRRVGSFRFYPNQHIIVKEAEEIPLSKKECELLTLFVARPNEVITREELTKRVWEDNGVIVGRSLDTYISKLRKKLQEDASIKLTNVHGVGYKLEY